LDVGLKKNLLEPTGTLKGVRMLECAGKLEGRELFSGGLTNPTPAERKII